MNEKSIENKYKDMYENIHNKWQKLVWGNILWQWINVKQNFFPKWYNAYKYKILDFTDIILKRLMWNPYCLRRTDTNTKNKIAMLCLLQ